MTMTKRMAGLHSITAMMALTCSTAVAGTLNVRATSGGSSTVTAPSCAGAVLYEVRGVLSDAENEGLAGFVMELAFSGGPMQPAEAPGSGPMVNFDRPAGITGPAGFGGTVVGGRLDQVGGAQNTIKNTADHAPFPVGAVITGVGHSEVVLVTGTLVTPTEPGTYTLTVAKLSATVIKQGQNGSGVVWETEPAGISTMTPLTITVLPAAAVATAANSGPVCGGRPATLLGGPAGMAQYSWTGPGGFVSQARNPLVSPAVPGTYALTITDANGCIDTAYTTVVVVPLPCEPWSDCNANIVHDACDVAIGTSQDLGGDGVPDECQTDCNHNGLDDLAEVLAGTSADCNSNSIPDDCELAATHNACKTGHGPGCNDPVIQACVCALDPYCCAVDWDRTCVNYVVHRVCGFCPAPDCNSNAVPDECDLAGGTCEDCNNNTFPDECETAAVHNCCATGHGGGCNDPDIQACVCAIDPYCCNTEWDRTCVRYVTVHVCGLCPAPDCNTNSVPDACEPDCNNNGFPDACDITAGTSNDCTTNGTPDECEADCNNNNTADSCELAGGTGKDCNHNQTLDVCDIAAGVSKDCQPSAVPDECELTAGTSPDCNSNGLPDECDVAAATSEDCDTNGVPDDCQPLADCNSNGVFDLCDIAHGTSRDCQSNGVPDECETLGYGDYTGDGLITVADYAFLSGCLTGPCGSVPCQPALYANPCCVHGDLDQDGDVDLGDFARFQRVFGSAAGQPSICRSPESLNVSCEVGANPPNPTFDVWNCGEGILFYTVTDNADWLTCTPSEGSSTVEHDTITCTFTTSSLAAGTYSATITISDPYAGNNPQTIPVTLTVADFNAGLLAYWAFDEGTGSTVSDSSGHGQSGTIYGPTWSTGIGTAALHFDGSGDYVDVPDEIWSEQLTVSAWINVHSFGTSDPDYIGKFVIFKAPNTGCVRDYCLYVAPSAPGRGGVLFDFGEDCAHFAGVSTGTASELVTSAWYHVAATRDGQYARLYINGQQVGAEPYSFVPTNHHHNLKLGMSASTVQSFDGVIDDVRIYDRALSAEEVRLLYENTGLVACWSFDRGTAQDDSGHDHDGVISGAVPCTGVSGQAFWFDGVNDYIEIPDTAAFEFANQSVTFVAWATIVDNANLYRAFVALEDSDAYPAIGLAKARSGYMEGRAYFQACDATPQCQNAVSDADGTQLPKHPQWLHVVGVVDWGQGLVNLYMDGVLQDSISVIPYDLSGAGNLRLRIGHQYGITYPGYHYGAIDEVRIYNRALSAGDIQVLYQQLAPGRGPAAGEQKSAANKGLSREVVAPASCR